MNEQQKIISYLIKLGYSCNPEIQKDETGKYFSLIKATYKDNNKIDRIDLIKVYIY